MKIKRKKEKKETDPENENKFLDGMKKVGKEYKKIVGDSLQGLVGM